MINFATIWIKFFITDSALYLRLPDCTVKFLGISLEERGTNERSKRIRSSYVATFMYMYIESVRTVNPGIVNTFSVKKTYTRNASVSVLHRFPL